MGGKESFVGHLGWRRLGFMGKKVGRGRDGVGFKGSVCVVVIFLINKQALRHLAGPVRWWDA